MVGLPKLGDLINLWVSSVNSGKIEVNYGVCVDGSTFTIYGAFKGEVCIVVTPKAFFKLFCNNHFLARLQPPGITNHP
jgi:hypothetical protein